MALHPGLPGAETRPVAVTLSPGCRPLQHPWSSSPLSPGGPRCCRVVQVRPVLTHGFLRASPNALCPWGQQLSFSPRGFHGQTTRNTVLPTQSPLPRLHKVLPARGQGPSGHGPRFHACTKGLPWFWPRRVPGQRMEAAEVGVQLTASELPAEAKPAAVTSERRLPGFRSPTRSLPGGRPAGGDQLPTCPRPVRPVNGPAGLPQSAPMDNSVDFGSIRPSLRGLHGKVPGGRGALLILPKDLEGQLRQGHLGGAALASDPEEPGRVHRCPLVSREASARPCTVVTC